jgi:hypothetical protein
MIGTLGQHPKPAWGGQTDPWSSGKIIALLTVGCVVLIGFFCYGRLNNLPIAAHKQDTNTFNRSLHATKITNLANESVQN